MDVEQVVKLVIAHCFRFVVLGIGLVAAIDVRNDFPDRPILDSAKVNFQFCGNLYYFGASEASVIVMEPVSGASAGSAFPSSVFPTGSSGTPNIAALTTS